MIVFNPDGGGGGKGIGSGTISSSFSVCNNGFDISFGKLSLPIDGRGLLGLVGLDEFLRELADNVAIRPRARIAFPVF